MRYMKKGWFFYCFLATFLLPLFLETAEISFKEISDDFILSNGVIEIAISKNSGYIKGFNKHGFSDDNLLLTTYLSFSTEEFGDFDNPHRHQVEIRKIEFSEDRRYGIFIFHQNWGYLKLEEKIILFPDKPYFQLIYKFKFQREIHSKNILLGVNPAKKLNKRIFNSGRLFESINTGRNNCYYYDPDFIKGGWIAFQSTGDTKGISILFPHSDYWEGFLKTPPWGRDNAEGFFQIQFAHPLGKNKLLTPDEEIVMDCYFLYIEGDAQTESEKFLKEIKDVKRRKMVSAVQTKEPPVIDGKIEDKCWENAPKISNFQISQSKGLPPLNQTEVRFAYDKENLYIAFTLFDIRMNMIKPTETNRDGLVWKDDDIEIFLMPASNSNTYYQIVLNPLGTEFDAVCNVSPFRVDTSWNSGMQSKVIMKSDRWEGEISIPWKSMNVQPSPGNMIKMDICRSKVSKWESPAELSNLFKSNTGLWHRPEDFGYLLLSDKEYIPTLMLNNQYELITNKQIENISVTLSNTKNKFYKIKCEIIGEEDRVIFENTRILKVREPQKQIEIPFFTKEKGHIFLNLSLFDTENNCVVFSNTYGLISKYGHTHQPQFFKEKNDYILWTTGSTIKILPDDELKHSGTNNEIEIKGGRNEYEVFQLIFTPKNFARIKDIRIEFTDLKGEKGVIRKENIKWNPVGYIKITHPSPFPDAFAGFWPDVLLEDAVFSIEEDRHYPLWITIYIPEDTPPGIYEGLIKILIGEVPSEEIKMRLKVWNFTLPSSSYLDVLSDVWFYGDVAKNVKYTDILENIRQHKMSSAGRVYPDVTHQGNEEEAYREYFEKYNMRWVLFPGFAGAGPWKERGTYYGLRIEPSDPEFRRLFIEKTREKVEFFRRNNWLDKVIFWLWDEPFFLDDNETRENLPRWAKLVRETAPDLKLLLTYYLNFDQHLNDPHALDGLIDILCVPLYFGPKYDINLAEQRKKEGIKIWAYHNQFYLTDRPAINPRIYPWLLWKYRIEGFVIWSINSWTVFKYDPWNYGETPYPTNKGDGLLLYPSKKSKDKLLNSIRWELLREGLEDYDYLYLLQEKMQKGNLSKQQMEEATRLLEIADGLVSNFEKYTKNEEDIYRLREKIGEFLNIINP